MVLLYYGVAPSWGVVWLLLLILLTLVATLGIGVTLAALTVFYRDFKHIVPFLVQILMYVTPVIYPAELIGPRWQLILSLNPMFGIVAAYRSAILGAGLELRGRWRSPRRRPLAIVRRSRIFYFRKIERRFADFA